MGGGERGDPTDPKLTQELTPSRLQVYPDGSLGIALTDTFTTRPFFEDFIAKPERARRWKGLRQDSGDPVKFIPMAKEAFEKVGADPKTSAPLPPSESGERLGRG